MKPYASSQLQKEQFPLFSIDRECQDDEYRREQERHHDDMHAGVDGLDRCDVDKVTKNIAIVYYYVSNLLHEQV